MKRVTVVVDGPLAFAMRRAHAAKAQALGLEVTTLPRLAARLCGGFVQPADAAALMPAIVAALSEGELSELGPVLDRPALPRAVMSTLLSIWRSDVDLKALPQSPRLSDIQILEKRVRAHLPPSNLCERDLRDIALEKVGLAQPLFGSITLDAIAYVEPLWRPLLAALSEHTPLSWNEGGASEASWFAGTRTGIPTISARTESFESCSDPNAEVIEALRWVRQGLSDGVAKASDFAICTMNPAAYDEAMLVARRASGLPIFFTHGVPVLATAAGQSCAALADLLTTGLDRDRVMRVLNRVGDAKILQGLPEAWRRTIPHGPALDTHDAWRNVLTASQHTDEAVHEVASILLPLIELFAEGPRVAERVGNLLLTGEAAAVWKRALELGPVHAVGLTLEHLRLPDEGDAACSIAWGPGDHVANAPRHRVRLLGLGTNQWPRRTPNDSILPGHIVDRNVLSPVSMGKLDRDMFEILRANAVEFCASYPRRSAGGALQTPGPLWPHERDKPLARLRVPAHAFSENDRLMARPQDARLNQRITRSRAVWGHWQEKHATNRDGLAAPGHPVIEHALSRHLSSGSLRRLLRNQLAFVWSEGMGWRGRRPTGVQLSLSSTEFGSLVHEVLANALSMLEAGSGIGAANEEERRHALATAAQAAGRRWPLERRVPPARLWNATLTLAVSLGLMAMNMDDDLLGRVDSWTEVGFGGATHGGDRTSPWPADRPVILGETKLHLSGRIDRLDVTKTRNGFMVTDYKTGVRPVRNTTAFDGGRNLQPLIYVSATRTHFADAHRMVARIVHLGDGDEPVKIDGDVLERALADLESSAVEAIAALRRGETLPGPDAFENNDGFRLALPADIQLYARTKSASFAQIQKAVATIWRR